MPKQIDFESISSQLQTFYSDYKRLPSFSEMQKLFGYSSKGGVLRLVNHLVNKKIVERDSSGRLIPTAILEGGVKLLGSVQAGFPSPAEEELIDILSLDEFLIQRKDATFMVKVTGDSMIDEGIKPGDLVLVERGKTVRDGDVVIAQVDGEWTMKFYYKKGKEVILKAANRKYPPIKPKEELVIGGVVTACIRKYAKS